MSQCKTCRIKIDSKRVVKPKVEYTELEWRGFFIYSCKNCDKRFYVDEDCIANFCVNCGVKFDSKHVENEVVKLCI